MLPFPAPMKASSLLLCSLFFTVSLQADWLNFRGPNASGYDASASSLPTTLSYETLAWEVSLPGRGLGSAVTVGDKVFVTAASGPDQKQLHILCFHAADGNPIWERRFWTTGRTMAHKKTSVAAPTPASDGERIYAFYSSNDVICLDLDGNLLWLRGLTLDYPNASNSLGMSSSPLVVGDTLVVQVENDSESFAAGLDKMTGINRWKLDRPKAANWTSPTLLSIDGQDIVALQSREGVLGVAPDTGSVIFHFGEGAATIPSSTPAGDSLYIPSGGLTAITVTTDGSEPIKHWNESAQRPGTSSPLVIGDKVFIINNAGVLNCANRETGERLWRIRLERADPSATPVGPFSGSPVAGADGLIYLFSEAGIGLVVDVSGEEGTIISEIELGETILSTATLDQGALYIRSDEHLWKFGR
ncbi:MAG: PQQ-binding-like beta-propeller repeat protein [Verrucomicrobiota bacterium]